MTFGVSSSSPKSLEEEEEEEEEALTTKSETFFALLEEEEEDEIFDFKALFFAWPLLTEEENCVVVVARPHDDDDANIILFLYFFFSFSLTLLVSIGKSTHRRYTNTLKRVCTNARVFEMKNRRRREMREIFFFSLYSAFFLCVSASRSLLRARSVFFLQSRLFKKVALLLKSREREREEEEEEEEEKKRAVLKNHTHFLSHTHFE